MRGLVAGVFERAKLFWSAGIAGKILIALMGLVVALMGSPPAYVLLIVLALEALSFISLYAADSLKSSAEPMLMRLDYEYGMGWPVPEVVREQYNADFGSLESLGAKIREGQPYFVSETAIGTERLKEAVLESALYTRDIAKGARNVVFSVFVLVALAFFCLLASGLYRLFTHGAQSGLEFAVDALIFLAGIDLLPLAGKYDQLVQASTHTRESLAGLHREEAILPAVIEYQLARSNAPLLPTFKFLQRRQPLGAIWKGPSAK